MALYPGSGGGHGGHGQRRPPPYPPIRDSWIHEVDSEVLLEMIASNIILIRSFKSAAVNDLHREKGIGVNKTNV